MPKAASLKQILAFAWSSRHAWSKKTLWLSIRSTNKKNIEASSEALLWTCLNCIEYHDVAKQFLWSSTLDPRDRIITWFFFRLGPPHIHTGGHLFQQLAGSQPASFRPPSGLLLPSLSLTPSLSISLSEIFVLGCAEFCKEPMGEESASSKQLFSGQLPFWRSYAGPAHTRNRSERFLTFPSRSGSSPTDLNAPFHQRNSHSSRRWSWILPALVLQPPSLNPSQIIKYVIRPKK